MHKFRRNIIKDLKAYQRTGTASFFLVLVLFGLFGAACNGAMMPPIATPTSVWNGVIEEFREPYRYWGGAPLFGFAISGRLLEGNLTVQYLTMAKLVHDAHAPAYRRFYFAPLAREMGIYEPPVPPPPQPSQYYIDGHYVHEDFWPLYERLGGALIVGPPLTEMRYNPVRRRYEQFFAGLGFYRLEGSNEVRLLAYGSWACGERCRPSDAPLSAVVDVLSKVAIDPTFVSFVSGMGTDFTGFPLTEAYLSRDGRWKQIFENVVLVANGPNIPASVKLAPLAKELKIASEPLRISTNAAGMFFFVIEGNQGYDIPAHFRDYINSHGGMEILGPPITHYAPLFTNRSNLSYHQCFVNLCLMYDLAAREGAHVRPEPFGFGYQQMYYEKDLWKTGQDMKETINLHVWEVHSSITSSQEQEIGVKVSQETVPLANVTPVLTLTLLDGSKRVREMPPTDMTGMSNLRLEPIAAPNSTMIYYEVCVPELGVNACISDSFVIWNNP